MKGQPSITLVTPSYNQGHFLEATIQSVLSQNYPNLEYIIVDGGSTDNSVEIIQKYSRNLSHWSSEPDQGQYDALNKGFALGHGDIMAWLNSDDMYYPWTLKAVASIMTEIPDALWISTLQQGWWDWYGMPLGFGTISGFSKAAFLDGRYLPLEGGSQIGWIQQESTFWRRSLWENTGARLSTEFHMAGDFDLWSRLFAKADLYGVESPLAGFRFQEAQKTRHDRYVAEAKISLDRMRSSCGWSPQGRAGRAIRAISSAARSPIRKGRDGGRYEGKRISRTEVNNPGAAWIIRDYTF